MKEPEIIVLSGETRIDQYGNFLFWDKTSKEHKVGARNKKKDELVKVVVDNPNRGVKLTYDTVKGKDGKDYDYISGIALTDIKIDESKLTEQQRVSPTKPAAPAPTKVDSKSRVFALSYAKDIACALIQAGKSITPKEVIGTASLFEDYLDNGYNDEALKLYKEIQAELKKED